MVVAWFDYVSSVWCEHIELVMWDACNVYDLYFVVYVMCTCVCCLEMYCFCGVSRV